MRVFSTSDLHLGRRMFAAVEGGRNLRELDVERAWQAVVRHAVRARPDLVTIAGDIFDHPRVTAHAVKAFRDGLRQVVDETDAQVVVILGNHDIGRTAEVLSPVTIPDDLPRVYVVERFQVLNFATSRGETVAVTCLPCEVLGGPTIHTLEPDRYADVNVLLIHAPVNTSAEDVERLPMFYAGVQALDAGRLAEHFNLVIAGDYHDFRRLHPTRLAFYSGSIERTSSNIWPEVAPKVAVLCDTWTREMELLEIPTRKTVDYDLGDFDLPPGASAQEVNMALTAMLNFDFLSGAIVRFRVDAFPRDQRGAIDWSVVRELKNRTAHFQMDLRLAAPADLEATDRREHAGRSLMDEAAAFLAADTVDVRTAALAYLGGAQ